MVSTGEIIGNYRLLEELGIGSCASVYRGIHTVLTTRIVAVKIMHMHLQSQREYDTFFHEARILEMLQHPRILQIIDVGTHKKMPYIVTTYASGGSLRQYLDQQAGKLLSLSEALLILGQIAQALDYAHQQNIIHRDLKPDNILFDAKKNVLLADFGISTILGSLSFHKTTPYGTPAYMAPEQFKGNVSRESDQYALGCIAYELFTGQKPFTAPDVIALGFKHLLEQAIPLRRLNANLPEHIEQATLRAMAKERKHRFQDIHAFISALQTPLRTSQEWITTALQTPLRTSQEWITEGDTFRDLKRFEVALEAYEQAIRLDPNFALAHYGRGSVLRDLRRFEAALEAYEQAIRLDPNFALAYFGKGVTLSTLRRFEAALEAYEQAIRLDPNFALAYHGKGNALSSLKRSAEAEEAHQKARKLRHT